jgi:hypothetical protein
MAYIMFVANCEGSIVIGLWIKVPVVGHGVLIAVKVLWQPAGEDLSCLVPAIPIISWSHAVSEHTHCY